MNACHSSQVIGVILLAAVPALPPSLRSVDLAAACGVKHAIGTNYLEACDAAGNESFSGGAAIAAGIRAVMAARRPRIRFTRVDLPTLGRPTTATLGRRPDGSPPR